jgi:hypothetical protein
VTIQHLSPPIWREISVPDTFTLLQLHRTIQMVFDWLDYHLFSFQLGGRRLEGANPETEGEVADNVRLRDLGLAERSSFQYVYDFGDDWEHEIVVRSVRLASADEEPDKLAYLVDGARAAPPEDAGGPPGYERALAALARQSAHEGAEDEDTEDEDAELVAWLGPHFDPERFDRRAGNHALMLATAWGVI